MPSGTLKQKGLKLKIGIDIGNVIIGGGGEDTTFFTDYYLHTPPVEGAFESIAALIHDGHEVELVSKAGDVTREKTYQWLLHWDFANITGYRATPYFVYHRGDKAPVVWALRCDIFIDDRKDILDTLIVMEDTIHFHSWEQTNLELQELLEYGNKG